MTIVWISSEPEGMMAPEVIPVNSSMARVLWLPPQQPNGAVTGYHVYVNDHLHGSVDNSSGSYLLGDLLPFTVYNIQVCTSKTTHKLWWPNATWDFSNAVFIQVKVCTVYACVWSDVTQTTTVEDLPADLATPHAQVITPRWCFTVNKCRMLIFHNNDITKFKKWQKS